MDTVEQAKTHLEAGQAPRRRVVPFLAACLLGSTLLLAVFVTLVAAGSPPAGAPQQSGDSAAPLAPQASFDLTLTKTHAPSVFTYGVGAQFELQVVWVSGDVITPTLITVTDQIPDGLTPINPTSANWSCSTAGQNVTCVTNSPIQNTTSFTPIVIPVTILPNVASSVSNTAKLESPGDTDPTNNETSDLNVQVSNHTNVRIEKTMAPISPYNTDNNKYAAAGQPITYTLTVTNNGPAVATNVTVKDTLPLEVNLIRPPVASVGTFTVASGTPTIIWTIPSMFPATSATLVIPAQVKPGTPNTPAKIVTNEAEVTMESPPPPDDIPGDDKSSVQFIVGAPDLKVTKARDIQNPAAGQTITYSVVVQNVGDKTANDINLTDLFNSNVMEYVFNSSSSTIGEPFPLPGELRWYTAIDLTPNQSFAFSFKMKLLNPLPDNVANISNMIRVEANPSTTIPPEQNLANNTFTDIAPVPAAALAITKSDGVTIAYPNQVLTYTITLANSGVITASNLIFTDTLVSNLSALSLIETDALDFDVLVNSGPTRVWRLNTAVGPARTITFRLLARVSAEAIQGSSVINTIAVSPALHEVVLTNNTSTDTNTIAVPPSMTIEKEVNKNQGKVGDTFVFKIRIRNTGGTAAANVRVTDKFLVGFDIVATTTQGTATFNSSTRTVTASIGTVNAGEEETVTINATVNSAAVGGTTYINQAVLHWDPDKTASSEQVRFRVVASTTLPGTGWGPSAGGGSADAGQAAPTALALLLALFLLGALAGAGALLARSNRLQAQPARKPGPGLWLLLLLAVLFFPACALMQGGAGDPAQATLDSLAGPKPGFSTPAPILQATDFADLWDEGLPTPTPGSLPDFPIPTPSIVVTAGPDGSAPDSSPVTRLRIPAMGLDTIVKYVPFENGSWLIGGLKQEIAWMGDTSWPGLGGNTGLAGHLDLASGQDGPFWNLDDLQSGDEVFLYTEQKLYSYHVREQKVVSDADMTILTQTQDPVLTLITCTGWDAELEAYLERLIVVADLVKTELAVSN